MNKINRRSPFAIVGRLIVLVKPMLPIMLAAIVMGVAGHFCATFITIFGGFGILRALGLASPVRTVGTAFACILVFALLRGVLRYAEQASNHYIAFKLLALIRDKVFGALRRLTPAKLEGRDRGDLISLITADIEVPNHPVDMSSWGGSACYPRSTFYPLSDGVSIHIRRITMPQFPACSACLPPSQAPLCHCTL